MSMEGLSGKVQTVLGRIEPEKLGVTLPHEHIITDITAYFIEPSEGTAKAMAHHPVTLDILWWLHYHLFQNLDDMKLHDEQLAIDEVTRFKNAGGDSLIEMSNIGLARDPLAIARISRATRLNIIIGAGYYISPAMGPEMDVKSEDEITEEIVRDITEGVGDTGLRAGIIGEVGTSWPITKNELKSLRAAARAQRLTGAPVNIHPGQNEDAANEVIRILDDAGADISRVAISHIDRAVRNPKNRSKLAKTGCYLEYDLFGREGYYPPHWRVIDLPNDHQRLNEISQLIDEGYLNQILISHDIASKTQLCAYGGWGYAHILRDTVPHMRLKGFSDEVIRNIMVDNPKRLMTFA